MSRFTMPALVARLSALHPSTLELMRRALPFEQPHQNAGQQTATRNARRKLAEAVHYATTPQAPAKVPPPTRTRRYWQSVASVHTLHAPGESA